MNIVRKFMAVSGIAATVALGSLAALPASAQSWHHHHRWHHGPHSYTIVRPVIIHRYPVHHHLVHHFGTTVTKTVTHRGHTTVTKTVVHHS